MLAVAVVSPVSTSQTPPPSIEQAFLNLPTYDDKQINKRTITRLQTMTTTKKKKILKGLAKIAGIKTCT
jgi:hypothetical protein